jgi:opacity protein-like surface antigen
MKCSMWRSFCVAALVGMAAGISLLPAAGLASEPRGDTSSESLLERLGLGGGGVSFDLGVAPLRTTFGSIGGPSLSGAQGGEPSVRLIDSNLYGTAMSFDLKLGWPGSERAAVEPYVTLGPALFIMEPDYVSRLLGTRADPTYRVGARAGAGLNWHLSKNATLFSAYEFTRPGQSGGLSPAARTPDDNRFGTYDFTYGLRFQY